MYPIAVGSENGFGTEHGGFAYAYDHPVLWWYSFNLSKRRKREIPHAVVSSYYRNSGRSCAGVDKVQLAKEYSAVHWWCSDTIIIIITAYTASVV
jgi:hypothetical protein